MSSLHSDPSLAAAEAVDEQGVGEISGEEAGKASYGHILRACLLTWPPNNRPRTL